jgi:tRNA (cytidine32/guanosine34-2'-O)-methyltransferase
MLSSTPPAATASPPPSELALAPVDARHLKSTSTLQLAPPLSAGLKDLWYRRAKEYGFRARSAFKLLQCDEDCHLFPSDADEAAAADGSIRKVARAVDLCAAPGSWSQVLVRKLYSSTVVPTNRALARIISVDLQEMAPLDGVHMVQGDITSRVTAEEIIHHFQGEMVDLVVSDGAPDVTGLHEIDDYMQSQLILAALNITTHILRPGTGAFVAKIFKAEAYDLLASQLRIFFHSVECVKPVSSRVKSAEHFVVCKGYRKPNGYSAVFLDAVKTGEANAAANSKAEQQSELNQLIMPYLRCGDLAPLDATSEKQLQAATEQTRESSEPTYTSFLQGLVEE